MNVNTRNLIVKPLIIQEVIIITILAPILLFFFRYISASVAKNFIPVVMCGSLAANVGLSLGISTKVLLASPAVRLMGKESTDPRELQRAARLLAILPMAEAVVTSLRFGVSGNLIATCWLMFKHYITIPEAVFAACSVMLMGLWAAPNIYLSAENSLRPFFVRYDLKPVMDSNVKIFRFSMSRKTLVVTFFLAVPPLCLILGLIYLSHYTRLDIESLSTGFYVVLLETVLMVFISSSLLMKNVAVSVEGMSTMFKDMAKGQGDLTKRIEITGLHEMGELAFWFNVFMNDIEEIVGRVRSTSNRLHDTAEDVNEGSQGLSQETQAQAVTMEQISGSISRMNAAISRNADLVVEGRKTSGVVTCLIDQNRQVFSDLMDAIHEISQDSQKIGDIVSTVNEVAFHTNLLALNASVEAARAGEHGKGFAVVAGEVRSLAQRSSEAAQAIRLLIEGTVSRIKTGDDMMRKTFSSLEELMSRMEAFFGMMEDIGASSTDQTKSMSELTSAVSQIDTSARHSATTAQTLADSMESLRDMAVTLTADVMKFKISRRD